MTDESKAKADEIPLMILTNERTPFKGNMMKMIYQACSVGQLGYMDGKNAETGEIVPMLVGLEPTGDLHKFAVYPLAKIFVKGEDVVTYLVPDGVGGYFDAGTDDSGSGSSSAAPDAGAAEAEAEARPTE
jgi:hypothetical protein